MKCDNKYVAHEGYVTEEGTGMRLEELQTCTDARGQKFLPN